MATTATILHADLDAFYVSVEKLLDLRLRGKPSPSEAALCLPPTKPRPLGFRRHVGTAGAGALRISSLSAAISSDYQRLGDAAIGDRRFHAAGRADFDPRSFADVAGRTDLFGSPAETPAPPRTACGRAWPADRSASHAPSIWRRSPRKWPSRRARGRRSRASGISLSCRSSRCGASAGYKGAAGRDRRGDDWATSKYAGLVARAAAGSCGRRETRSAGVESRSTATSRRDSRARSAGAQSALGRKPARASRSSHLLHLADRDRHPAPRRSRGRAEP